MRFFIAILVAVGLSGCDRQPRSDSPNSASTMLHETDYDQSCSTDSDCVLVDAREQCGPCDPCPIRPIAASAEAEFRADQDSVTCGLRQRAECEPCIVREAFCDGGTCAARAPSE